MWLVEWLLMDHSTETATWIDMAASVSYACWCCFLVKVIKSEFYSRLYIRHTLCFSLFFKLRWYRKTFSAESKARLILGLRRLLEISELSDVHTEQISLQGVQWRGQSEAALCSGISGAEVSIVNWLCVPCEPAKAGAGCYFSPKVR